MARSRWKGFAAYRVNVPGDRRIWGRNQRILSHFVGQIFHVYNGKRFGEVLVNERMVGRFFGEYTMSRSMDVSIHSKKSKGKKK